jgi:hypothetical protein
MTTPARLVPIIEQYDWACGRLLDRLTGPDGDSGSGTRIEIPPMSDAEYRWEPVPGCWSVRSRSAGPGPRAGSLAGAGDWGRDAAAGDQPWPPPFTTIAWRMSHLSEMLAMRANWTNGSHTLTRDKYESSGTAAGATGLLRRDAQAWRDTLASVDDAALDTVGYCTHPNGSDAEDLFLTVVWWVNQEVLHHGAEIALLRDLYRDQPTT